MLTSAEVVQRKRERQSWLFFGWGWREQCTYKSGNSQLSIMLIILPSLPRIFVSGFWSTIHLGVSHLADSAVSKYVSKKNDYSVRSDKSLCRHYGRFWRNERLNRCCTLYTCSFVCSV